MESIWNTRGTDKTSIEGIKGTLSLEPDGQEQDSSDNIEQQGVYYYIRDDITLITVTSHFGRDQPILSSSDCEAESWSWFERLDRH